MAGKLFRVMSAFKLRNRVAISYMPDSIAIAKGFPHIKMLYQRFRMFNEKNNGGDVHRLTSIVFNIEKVIEEDNIEGDFAELGVWKGNTASVLAFYAAKYQRQCYLFDTFEGFDSKDLVQEDSRFSAGVFSDTSVDIVKEVIGPENTTHCHFIKGYFPESVPLELSNKKFSVVSLDADLYQPMKAGLEWFFERMDDGALFLLHDYSSGYWDGCKRAIDEFCAAYKQRLVLMPDKSGSAFLRVRK